MEMKKKVTINDIAREAGVSKSTVYRALSEGAKNVEEDTLMKVLEKAKELGYGSTHSSRKQTKTIGIVVPELFTITNTQFISFAQDLLHQKGYRTMVFPSNENPEIEKDNLEMIGKNQVTGMLISACHPSQNKAVYKDLQKSGIPLVFFDRTIDDFPASKIKTDNYGNACVLLEYLIRLEKKHIVLLNGSSSDSNTQELTRAYKDVTAKHQCPVNAEYILSVGADFEDGEKGMEDFMKKQLPFDAVFGFSEKAAIGTMNLLQKFHYAIPEEVAVCCLGSNALSTLVQPALTTIEQPTAQMAEKSVELLLEKLENPDIPDKEIVLESKIIIRGATEKNKK